GRIIFMNPYGLNFFGYTMEEIQGRHVLDTIVPEVEEGSQRNLREMIAAIQADPDAFRLNENENIKKNGERVWISWTNRALVDGEGRIREILSIGNDVTEKKKLQNQLLQAQKLEAIGTLAGGIAHDFNNLLMGIQGYVSLLMLDLGPASPHIPMLERIERQVQSGAQLTQRLLGIARGGKYEVKPTNINALIAQNVETFQRTKREVRMICTLAPDIVNILADRNQMEQVLLNLFINAWQAMPAGGDIFITTENVFLPEAAAVSRGLNPGPHVKITIRDTGMGMDEKTMERIFDPFFTTKGMGRGTGLGLASAYGIIKNHGGHIEVTSQKGQGAVFHIYLPAAPGPAAALTEKGDETTLRPGGETILVIDDEVMNTDILQKLLEKMGYRVMTALSGADAITLYRRQWQEIDLVIIDMIMPVMDGGETFDRLAQINPRIRAILASGYSRDGKAEDILARGVKAFIQKPFRMAELSRCIRDVLDGSPHDGRVK
ncbi:MAG: response regulator, partial [Syntrophales bacterium]|nr:response regulator [Syntrophales bacterium]